MEDQIAEAIKAATNKSWEAGLLAVVFVLVVFALSWIMKTYMGQAFQREERMAKRIDALEESLRTQLVVLVKDNNAALLKLTDVLESRTCLMENSKQDRLVEEIAERVVAAVNGTKG